MSVGVTTDQNKKNKIFDGFETVLIKL